MSILSENILKRLGELDMTQDKLAKLVGYKGRASVNRIINGEGDIPFSKIEVFAHALKTTPAALCGWDMDEDEGGRGFNLEVLAQRLRKNEYDALVFSNKEEAADYILKRCEGKTVGLANSITCANADLFDKFRKVSHDEIYESDNHKNRESSKKAMIADVYILSAGAISYKSGEMVNITGRGVRVAGSLSADEVIFLIGKDKIARNLDEALYKMRNVYVPKVAKANGYQTPCAKSGKCEDCNSVDRVCRFTGIYHRNFKMVHTTIVLVDEDLGA